MINRLSGILIFLWAVGGMTAGAENIFGLYAPPGSISINATYEWNSEESLQVQIEHEGDAVSAWFLVLDKGQAPDYTTRQANQGVSVVNYQVFKDSSPHTNVVKAPPESLSTDNVITTGDFGTFTAVTEIVSFPLYFAFDSGQFSSAGVYNDTLVLSLYLGDPALPGTHILVESVSVSVTIRMAELMDVYIDREPGISSLDLLAPVSEKLIATIHERSNASLGYTVSLTSQNFVADSSGHSRPYLLHETGSDFLEYDLSYGGSAVSSWVNGVSVITDSPGITDSGTTWLDKELRITYGSGLNISSGYYQDRLILTILAK